MMKIIIFIFKTIFLIFHDLIKFYENFMTLIYQENNLLRNKMYFYFIIELSIQNVRMHDKYGLK